MHFTDIFIRRPVLASVISLLILVLGLRALGTLQVLQYPRTQNAIVTINTVYYGADPNVVAASSPRRWKMPSPRPTASITCHRPAPRV
jgi:multidrug efflux pump subunit AcrB